MGSLTTPATDDELLTTIGLLMEAHTGLVTAFERRLADAGAPTGQAFEVLIRLARSPEHRLRMSALAAQMTLTASGVTRAVDRLEREGLVERVACPEDRRAAHATLTEEGRRRISAALPVHVEHLREVLAGPLDAEELATLGSLLRKLRDAVNPCAAVGTSTPPAA